jgi:hypothetical protein
LLIFYIALSASLPSQHKKSSFIFSSNERTSVERKRLSGKKSIFVPMKNLLYIIGLILFFAAGTTAANSDFFGARGEVAAKTGTNTITRSKPVLGHIFRDAPGHVNPSTITSQNRYINLFESVGNNPLNLNRGVLNSYQQTVSGFQGYSQTFRNGQVWIQVRNGNIFDAGVNIIPR